MNEILQPIAVSCLMLLVPGYLLLRGLRMSRIIAFCAGPVITVAFISVECILYPMKGIETNWQTLLLPAAVVGLVLFVIVQVILLLTKREYVVDFGFFNDGFSLFKLSSTPATWICVVLALGVSFFMGMTYFFGQMSDVAQFPQGCDNISHINTVAAYLESGNWSSLAAGPFPESDTWLNPMRPDGYESFYPGAWRDVACLIATVCGVGVLEAINLTNFVFAYFVFPLGMILLIRTALAKCPAGVLVTPVLIMAVSAFPWVLLYYGPLFPNMAAFASLPAFCAMVVGILVPVNYKFHKRLLTIIPALVAAVAVLLLHPNALFAAYVFLAPLGAFFLAQIPRFCGMKGVFSTILGVFIFLAALFLLLDGWFVLSKVSLFQGIMSQSFRTVFTLKTAVVNAALLAYNVSVPVYMVAGLVGCGVITCIKERRGFWLVLAWLVASGMYVACAALPMDSVVRHLAAGIFYNDAYRLAAFAAIFSIPVAAMGVHGICSLLGFVTRRKQDGIIVRGLLPAIAAIAVFCCTIAPGIAGPAATTDLDANGDPFDISDAPAFTPMEYQRARSHTAPFSPDIVYTPEERAFVDRCLEIIGTDTLVVNMPDDGSVYAYGVSGMRTMYRYIRTYGTDAEPEDIAMIRNHLSEYSWRPEVAAAVHRLGVQYVLLLDQGTMDDADTFFTWDWYKDCWWWGLNSITDSTEGFTVVLAEGDMRLYYLPL